MPGDGFALAVGVGGQVNGVRLGRLLLQRGQKLAPVVQRPIGGHPAAFDVDAEARLGQIADVPLAGGDLEVGAKVFVDRLGLGRRLDDHQAFLLPCSHSTLLGLLSNSTFWPGARRPGRKRGRDARAPTVIALRLS